MASRPTCCTRRDRARASRRRRATRALDELDRSAARGRRRRRRARRRVLRVPDGGRRAARLHLLHLERSRSTSRWCRSSGACCAGGADAVKEQAATGRRHHRRVGRRRPRHGATLRPGRASPSRSSRAARPGSKARAATSRPRGGRAIVCAADVSDRWAVDAAAARAEEELGPIDIWINCAMVTVFGEFEQLTMDEFRRVTEVTYLGYVHGTHAALAAHAAARSRHHRAGRHRRWPIAAFRCSRPIAAPSTPSAASPTRCAPSSCTTTRRCGSPRCTCRR